MKMLTGLGRKFILTLICATLLSCAYVGSGFWDPLQAHFNEFAMGLSGLLGIYCGGNVTNKLVTKDKAPPQPNNEMEGF